MKFKESHLYAAVIAILLIAVLGVVYHAAGKSIQEINRDRMINRIFATQTFFKMDSDHRVKMQTLTFAIKGMESRGENTTAIKNPINNANGFTKYNPRIPYPMINIIEI